MAVAVNCLVTDARRKFVCESILCDVRKSVTPYPRWKTTAPFRRTSTAPPGALLDLKAAKTESILCADTWAAAEQTEIAEAIANAAADSVLTRCSLLLSR